MLVLIGVVGMQLATGTDSLPARILPFHGPAALFDVSTTGGGAILRPVLGTAVYGLGLLIVARIFMARRVEVTRHSATRPSSM